MKITADWISAAPSRQVLSMLTDVGHDAYFVGGCVRNALLGAAVNDIDIATDALPDEVLSWAENAGLQAIPTGIEHGTVTVIAAHQPYEITTFRKDIATDGRHAVVAFSQNISDDAQRRDFTMNALYADGTGRVLDPLGVGLRDLTARRFRFIGDPQARIREDYLRILRFFRFHAVYGDAEAGIDADGLAACAELADGLEQISAERITAEMTKLLNAADPCPSVAAMRQSGVIYRILPGADDSMLAPLVHFETHFHAPPEAMRRLAAICPAPLADSLRLSKRDAAAFTALRAALTEDFDLRFFARQHGCDLARSAILLRSAALSTAPTQSDWNLAATAGQERFPVVAADLMPGLQGKALGRHLRALEDAWVRSDFTLSKAALLTLPVSDAP